MSEQQNQTEAAGGGSALTSELDAQRATVQAQLDEAMAALQRYSRIKGVRYSDIARASLGPALLKKRLDNIDAQIAASELTQMLGLTQMDFFAAHALNGLMLLPDEQWQFDFKDCRGGEETWSDHMAMAAYSIAEAMLRARKHPMFDTPNAALRGGEAVPLESTVMQQETK